MMIKFGIYMQFYDAKKRRYSRSWKYVLYDIWFINVDQQKQQLVVIIAQVCLLFQLDSNICYNSCNICWSLNDAEQALLHQKFYVIHLNRFLNDVVNMPWTVQMYFAMLAICADYLHPFDHQKLLQAQRNNVYHKMGYLKIIQFNFSIDTDSLFDMQFRENSKTPFFKT